MVKINIQMPDNCCECPCANEETYCQAVNRPLNSETYDKHRPSWCPLIVDETETRSQHNVWCSGWKTPDCDTCGNKTSCREAATMMTLERYMIPIERNNQP